MVFAPESPFFFQILLFFSVKSPDSNRAQNSAVYKTCFAEIWRLLSPWEAKIRFSGFQVSQGYWLNKRVSWGLIVIFTISALDSTNAYGFEWFWRKIFFQDTWGVPQARKIEKWLFGKWTDKIWSGTIPDSSQMQISWIEGGPQNGLIRRCPFYFLLFLLYL